MKTPNQHQLSILALWFKALGDEGRLKICIQLKQKGECSVNELVDATDISQASVSKHLAKLREAKIVHSRREGTSVIYSLRGGAIHQVCDIVCPDLTAEHQRIAKSLSKSI